MGHTCDQHRSRFGRYGCYTSCRLRANDSELSACFKYGRNSTVPEYDHCHASTCANDTLYMETLMEAVESSVCADKRRQYVTGFSVGGMMAYWVAVKFAERFAAAIPVAGSALMRRRDLRRPPRGREKLFHLAFCMVGCISPQIGGRVPKSKFADDAKDARLAAGAGLRPSSGAGAHGQDRGSPAHVVSGSSVGCQGQVRGAPPRPARERPRFHAGNGWCGQHR